MDYPYVGKPLTSKIARFILLKQFAGRGPIPLQYLRDEVDNFHRSQGGKETEYIHHTPVGLELTYMKKDGLANNPERGMWEIYLEPSEANGLKASLQLSVSNFGPIAKADIDLRPLTVFVGPSNTGKSYLAILIYALHKFFSRYSGRPNQRRYAPIFLEHIDTHPISDYDNVRKLVDWLRSVSPQEKGKSLSVDSLVELPDFIVPMIQPLFNYLNNYIHVMANEIKQSFGVADPTRLIRHGNRNGAKITLMFKPFEYEIELKGRRAIGELSLSSEETPLYINLYTERMQEVQFWATEVLHTPASENYNDMLRDNVQDLIREFFTEVLHNVVNPLNSTVHYLPADRAGVMHAGRELIVSLIERASYPALQKGTLFPTLPGALANFLQQLVDLDEPRGQEDIAANLEREILRGAIHIKKSEIGYSSFFYQPQGWTGKDIPLMNTSSMVSELAPVVLYLRHLAQPGDVVIIEEPESHLHPAMQVEFIRQLAAVVNSGIRVMLTTHSEWVLDELTNLVRLGNLPKERREGIASADFALNPDEVGVWLFEPKQRPKGSVVKEIRFDEEFGGFRSGFDEVAMRTYNDYAKISNRIERSGMHDESH